MVFLDCFPINKKDLSGTAIAIRIKLQNTVGKHWDHKTVVDRESRLIPRKIKETINSLKNPDHIIKISYAS